jgi:hypothetical protein
MTQVGKLTNANGDLISEYVCFKEDLFVKKLHKNAVIPEYLKDVVRAVFVQISELSKTDRGSGGFWSHRYITVDMFIDLTAQI